MPPVLGLLLSPAGGFGFLVLFEERSDVLFDDGGDRRWDVYASGWLHKPTRAKGCTSRGELGEMRQLRGSGRRGSGGNHLQAGLPEVIVKCECCRQLQALAKGNEGGVRVTERHAGELVENGPDLGLICR